MIDQPGHSFVKIFFALWPTAAERGDLAVWQTALKRIYGGRVMREETLHNTLVFIGEIDQSRLEALKLSALEVSASRFELSFEQAHYWGHNRIVYAAPDLGPPQLIQLHDVLAQCLSRHQFSFD